ncbi:MAG: extracellular solute-binding protein, partial [Butyrivibrio sp.]|nr:extracellular solute-binding protein [Butyrivibrio sp.]
IRNIFETHDINGVTWDRCAAGYMWGITGFVYNPDVVSKEEASTWKLLENADYKRQVTIKDNVRDAYFAAVGALKSDLLTSDEFKNRPDYAMALQDEMNDVSLETVNNVQEYLQQVKDNLYSFETDSGKADMITGKVVANYQWSGDAVYTMDQAEEDDYYLNFAAPRESTNIYFDGWVMLKKGISQDPAKQQAAEAFINFVSRPDNAIRDMYYIGYTSVISGGDDGRVFEYLEWTYGAEDDTEDVTEYPVGYFFSGDPDDEDYILTVPTEQLDRQLGAQYPSSDVIDRASIMIYFDQAQSEVINRMWIRVRCFNILNVPVWVWIAGLLAICAAVFLILRHKAAKEKLYN